MAEQTLKKLKPLYVLHLLKIENTKCWGYGIPFFQIQAADIFQKLMQIFFGNWNDHNLAIYKHNKFFLGARAPLEIARMKKKKK